MKKKHTNNIILHIKRRIKKYIYYYKERGFKKRKEKENNNILITKTKYNKKTSQMSYFMITSIHFSVTISILQSLKRDNKHLTSFTEFIISSSIYILSLMKLLINYKLFQIIIRTYFSELSLRLFSRAIKHSTTKIGQSAIRLSLTIILFA